MVAKFLHSRKRERSGKPSPVSIANEHRKRTIKAPVKANNPYGRGGTWACRLCRDRRWKVSFSLLMFLTRVQCEYTSFEDPCRLCRLRNVQDSCVKITAAEYDPSRVVRGGNGTCKNDTEQMLLDYAYSDEFYSTGLYALLVRSMASVFGSVPRHSSLLHSILAVSSSEVNPAQNFRHFEYHTGLAIRTLKQRLRTPAKLVEADACGAALVVVSDFASCGKTSARASNINLCLSILGHLTQQRASTSDLRIIPIFVPIFLHAIRLYACLLSGRFWLDCLLNQTSRYRSTFRDWRTCAAELKRVSFRNGLDVPTMSVLYTLEDLLHTAWACLYGEVTKTVWKVQWLETAGGVCDDITQTLNDPEFQNMVRILNEMNFSQNSGSQTGGVVDTVTYASLGNQALNGLVAVLQTTTVTTGLAAVEESSIPAGLLNASLNISPTLCDHYLSQYIYRVALVLGACTVSRSQLLTCTFSAFCLMGLIHC
jgi:hypothetical protein